MKAVDTNILVYTEIVSSPFHARAREVLIELAEGPAPWAIPWHCAYEFLRIVTHPRIYHPPVPLEVAQSDLAAILSSPSVRLISETDRHQEIFERVLSRSSAKGNLVHDARIYAVCLDNGVSELLTADADFLRFEGLKVSNPFRA